MRGDSVDGLAVAPVQSEKHWGASLGGPVIKDRVFLFGAYSHEETGYGFDNGPDGAGYPNTSGGVTLDQFNQISDILSTTYGIDTGPLVTNLPYTSDRYFVRSDINITDDHRLELTYQHLDENSIKEDDYYNSGNGSTVTGRNNFYNSGTKSEYFSGRLYSNWTEDFSTEIRYSHSKVQDLQDPVGGGEAQSDNPIPRIIVGTTTASGYGAGRGRPGSVSFGERPADLGRPGQRDRAVQLRRPQPEVRRRFQSGEDFQPVRSQCDRHAGLQLDQRLAERHSVER